MAAKDRKRYDNECAARDAEVESEQAARRAAREAPVAGPRVHKASPVAAAPVRSMIICVRFILLASII
jgi:hypothetical protein